MKIKRKIISLSLVLTMIFSISTNPYVTVKVSASSKSTSEVKQNSNTNLIAPNVPITTNVLENNNLNTSNIDDNKSSLSKNDKVRKYLKKKFSIRKVAGATGSIVIGGFLTSLSSLFLDGIKTAINKIYSGVSNASRAHKLKKLVGYKSLPEAFKNIENIANDKSDTKIYGQAKAKSQVFNALSGCLQRIYDSKDNKQSKNTRGNVIYMVGPSGVGKTTMANAIADAVLRHAETSSIFIDSSDIIGEQELGKQLFKTVFKYDIVNRRNKTLFKFDFGVYQKETESPLLDHVVQFPEAVVIIDEYDKMKLKSKAPGKSSGSLFEFLGDSSSSSDAGQDKSADEILKSISATGRYKISFDEIDCSKVLFIVTTNETKEELEKNFGINGKTGGGIQRLNVIEFDYLDLDSCKQIVNDTIEETKAHLMNKDGYFKINSLNFNNETIDALTQYIFNNKDMQGRAKFFIKDAILNLFSTNMEENQGKDFNISYTDSGIEGVLGEFTKVDSNLPSETDKTEDVPGPEVANMPNKSDEIKDVSNLDISDLTNESIEGENVSDSEVANVPNKSIETETISDSELANLLNESDETENVPDLKLANLSSEPVKIEK